MPSNSSNWPSDWPQNCPPHDAADACGEVYRIVSADPPSADDLESYAELGIAARGSECRRRAISVFKTRNQAYHRLRMSKHLAGHGKLKLTDPASGHLAW